MWRSRKDVMMRTVSQIPANAVLFPVQPVLKTSLCVGDAVTLDVDELLRSGQAVVVTPNHERLREVSGAN